MRRSLLVSVAASLVAGAGFGCSDQLPPATRVDRMRVLAVRAEPPEVSPGGRTRLDALVAWPVTAGASPAASYLWLACRQAAAAQLPVACGVSAAGQGGPDAFAAATDGGAPSEIPDCAGHPEATLCQLGTGEAVDYDPPGYPEQTTQLIVTLIVSDRGTALECARAAALAGTGAPPDPDHCTIGIKRVTLSAPPMGSQKPLNANPHLVSLSLNGRPIPEGSATFPMTTGGAQPATVPLESERCTSVQEGSPACPAGSASQQKDDGSYETIFVSWFATAGKPQDARTSFMRAGCSGECLQDGGDKVHTEWTVPDQDELNLRAPGGVVRFWAVVRDDRGGVSWLPVE